MLFRRFLALMCVFVAGFVASHLTMRPVRISVVRALSTSPLPEYMTISRPDEPGRLEVIHLRPIRQGTSLESGNRNTGTWRVSITQGGNVWYWEAERLYANTGAVVEP